MQALTTVIQMKDAKGAVIGEREVATYAGLLSRAHEEELESVTTSLVQVPHPDNGLTAICTATVKTKRGTFAGIGDANPENVSRKLIPHLIRMAETRAKARALRDAVNIGIVCLEELGGFEAEESDRREPHRTDGDRSRNNVRHFPRENADDRNDHGVRRNDDRDRVGRSDDTGPRHAADRMTDNQRGLLLRLLVESGVHADQAAAELCRRAGVERPQDITKRRASELIDEQQRQRRT